MFFERHGGGERAILVHLEGSNPEAAEDPQEFQDLALSAGADMVALVTVSRHMPTAKFLIGSGKVEELRDLVRESEAELVIFNHTLTPSQERNLERVFECRVLDRTGLILDIFAQRARTHEGKLQVELAQLRHLSTRLVRGWTHLERQKGGIGLRGPGETQLETDRRLLRERIKAILRRLDKVAKQREQGRRARNRNEVPTVSLVGYTNAGKSTLFNQLTDASVYAADQLFATLDPTLRKLVIQDVGDVILADTVGFIRHLPHDLVAAFKATLQETREADLLLHVVDCADEQMQENIESVQRVLAEIEADDRPQLMICNKIDKLGDRPAGLERDEAGRPVRVWLSAQTGEGSEYLFQALTELLAGSMVHHTLQLPPSAARLRSALYRLKGIEQEGFSEEGDFVLEVRLQLADWNRLMKQEGESLQRFIRH
mgnify:CR=1 FL=1